MPRAFLKKFSYDVKFAWIFQIILIFLCHELIIKMHCIGTSEKSILQKLCHGMNHSLPSNKNISKNM